MLLNKKGMETWAVVSLILAILAVVILLFFSKVFAERLGENYDKEACRQSVLQNSFRIEVGGTEIFQPFKDIKCPTISQTVKEVDNNRIFRVLANHLYDCWDKFGEGKIKFLDPQTKDYCVICSRVEFEGEARGKQISGFVSFLAKNKIGDDKGVQYSDLTYMEFLTPYETKEGLAERFENLDRDVIDTKYDYATLFVYYKQQNIGRVDGLLKAAAFEAGAFGLVAVIAGVPVTLPVLGLGAVAGGVTGYMAGKDYSADWGARVVLVPYQDISKIGCDALK